MCLAIPLDDEDIDALSKRAQELGIGASTLARMRIRERLHRADNSAD